MKKVITKAVAAIMVLLLLFACNKKEEMIVKPNFEANLTIQNDDITMEGKILRQIDGTLEYEISSPSEISGMKYVYSENMFTVYYHNMERSGDIWQNSPVKIIFNVINMVVAKPVDDNSVMTESGKCVYQVKDNTLQRIEVSDIIAIFEYK